MTFAKWKCIIIWLCRKKYIEGKRNFLLIDEVQMCEGFERAINGFHAEEKYDLEKVKQELLKLV